MTESFGLILLLFLLRIMGAVLALIQMCQLSFTSRSSTMIDERVFRRIYKNYTDQTVNYLQEIEELLQIIADSYNNSNNTSNVTISDTNSKAIDRISEIHHYFWLNCDYLSQLPKLLYPFCKINPNIPESLKSSLLNKLQYVPIRYDSNIMIDTNFNGLHDLGKALIISSREIAINLIANNFDVEANIISLLYEYCWDLLAKDARLPEYRTIFEYELAIREYPDYLDLSIKRVKVMIDEFGLVIISPEYLNQQWKVSSGFFKNSNELGNAHFTAFKKLMTDKNRAFDIFSDITFTYYFKAKIIIKILSSISDKEYELLLKNMDKSHKSNIVIVSDLYLQLQFMIQYFCAKSSTDPLENFLYSLKLCDRLDIIRYVIPQAIHENDDGFIVSLCDIWMNGNMSCSNKRKKCVAIAEIINYWRTIPLRFIDQLITDIIIANPQLFDRSFFEVTMEFVQNFRILQDATYEKFKKYVTENTQKWITTAITYLIKDKL